MTFYLRDSREGIEVVGISVAGIQINLDVPQRLSAAEIVKLSQAEGVYLNTREVF